MPLLVASADRALGGRIVPVDRVVLVEKVVVHPDRRVLQGAGHQKEVRLAGATARRVAVPADAEPQALACLEPPMGPESLAQPELLPERERQASLQQEQEQMAEMQAPRLVQAEQVSEPLPEEQGQLEQPAQLASASAQQPPAEELQEQPLVLRALARLELLPGAGEPLWPLLPSHPCPPWLWLRRQLLHPRRPEGACEPSRLRPPEWSWSASSFLEHRTRATGR